MGAMLFSRSRRPADELIGATGATLSPIYMRLHSRYNLPGYPAHPHATVAQLVEQLIRNQQVVSSILTGGCAFNFCAESKARLGTNGRGLSRRPDQNAKVDGVEGDGEDIIEGGSCGRGGEERFTRPRPSLVR